MLPLLPLLLMASQTWLLQPQSMSASSTPAAVTGSDLLTLLLAEAQAPATRDFMLACR